MLERDYQAQLIPLLEGIFPGCFVMKQDTSYQQGVPDLVIFYRNTWAMLEVKRKKPTRPGDWEPNQPYFLEKFDNMSFAACIYPENEQEVIDALQQAFQPRRTTRFPKPQ